MFAIYVKRDVTKALSACSLLLSWSTSGLVEKEMNYVFQTHKLIVFVGTIYFFLLFVFQKKKKLTILNLGLLQNETGSRNKKKISWHFQFPANFDAFFLSISIHKLYKCNFIKRKCYKKTSFSNFIDWILVCITFILLHLCIVQHCRTCRLLMKEWP